MNLGKILDSLKAYGGNVRDLEKRLIVSTLKCVAVSLRQHAAIADFLKHKELLLLRVIKLMKQNVSVQPIIQHGLMVFKQLFCTEKYVYDLIEDQLEIKYIKIFISQIMLG